MTPGGGLSSRHSQATQDNGSFCSGGETALHGANQLITYRHPLDKVKSCEKRGGDPVILLPQGVNILAAPHTVANV